MALVTHLKVNCFANVKGREGKMNKTARMKLKWGWEEGGGSVRRTGHTCMFLGAVLGMFINNRCGMKSWRAVILRLSTLRENRDTLAYILFDSDKHLPILSNLSINHARSFAFSILFFCHLKKMSFNSHHAVIMPCE